MQKTLYVARLEETQGMLCWRNDMPASTYSSLTLAPTPAYDGRENPLCTFHETPQRQCHITVESDGKCKNPE